ncbi:hypothetical protein F7725_024322 [Dissostichus mawsoni]|uniref:Uncharacterized protein n=1 Tax=Dissostichus mawsoni TaxID=36200 RepID=A0A7J5XZV8_DISMA|nr:hypothetical protein F7725_024322 [Dissostichus mawsoni]
MPCSTVAYTADLEQGDKVPKLQQLRAQLFSRALTLLSLSLLLSFILIVIRTEVVFGIAQRQQTAEREEGMETNQSCVLQMSPSSPGLMQVIL